MGRQQINKWRDYHLSLGDTLKEVAKKEVLLSLEISSATFYVYMKTPQRLKYWQKVLIAKAYNKKLEDFFTEVKQEAIPI